MTIDLTDLSCPLPIARTKKALYRLRTNQKLLIRWDNPSPATYSDFQDFIELLISKGKVSLLESEYFDGTVEISLLSRL